MLGRQSVRITYAHKKRRVQNTSKKLLSSPLEVLPPETDDLTRTQMARRMLKRSRRAALSEQSEDKNVERIREHLTKRIRYNQERVSHIVPVGMPFGASPQDNITFQTPLSSPHMAHESAVAELPGPEQLSPVPVNKRTVSCTSSRNLKENNTLASPFSSRPGSAASSPKHKGGRRPSRRTLRGSLHTKSRTLSGVFREDARRGSRNSSTVSLQDANIESHAKSIRHHRCPSNPSTSYMRSQFTQEDWFVPLKALSCTVDHYNDAIPSSGGVVHSDGSFYASQPQSCSTPAISRLRRAPDLQGRKARTNSFLDTLSPRKESTEAGDPDVEMMDGTIPPRRRAVYLSGNSIFSSSDEFTIASLSTMNSGAAIADGNGVPGQGEALARVARQVSPCRGEVGSQAGRHSVGSFVTEYDIPLVDMDYSPVPTASTEALGPEGAYRSSVGKQLCNFPGTSPVHGGALVIRTCKKSATLVPPALPSPTAVPCPPSSPASDLAQEFGSMDIGGDLDVHSDGEAHRSSVPILLARAHSLQDALGESTTKKFVKRMPARNRASTIRASDFVKSGPGTSSSGGVTVSLLSNVKRTRSGTVVGPDSKLATKGSSTKGAPTTGLRAVQSELESDDELLLKVVWMEDLEYLGLAVPVDEDVETDELNLGGLLPG